MDQLRNRVAVVTGGGSGIGEGMCLAFAAEGMNVVVADIDLAAAERVAEQVRASDVRAIAVPVDVSDPASVEALAERAYEEFGEVHLLCNNAGVLFVRSIAKTTLEDWQWMLSVNLFGVVHGLIAFLPRMRAQGGEAHIVNTGSMAGLVTPRPGSHAAYATSKFGVVALSDSLRDELEPDGIGVSVLCPGGVDTEIRAAERNRPDRFGGPQPIQGRPGDASIVRMPPAELAQHVVSAVRENRRYIITHPDRKPDVVARYERLLSAFDEAAAG